MSRILVHKLNTRGEVVVTYAADVVERRPNGVMLRAAWTRPTLDLGYTVFEAGAAFLEWFYTDRWYNIFQIHGAAGELKGWYCNVAEPAAVSDADIRYCDLHLDLWVDAGGHTLLLDEDEFEADLSLDADTRAQALKAVDELRQLVTRRSPPFDRIGVGQGSTTS